LRHKRVVSRLERFGSQTTFHRLLPDDAETPGLTETKLVDDQDIRRVVICTGKVYYDLLEEREKRGINDVYLLRAEQLYPFPTKELLTRLSRFKAAELVWCQEEPRNQGAWTFVEPYLEWVLNHKSNENRQHRRPRYVGRPAAAAPATGLMSRHLAQLKAFLDDALG
jgi:2-oxoglutarate dehydrogenase E1 component